MNYLLDTCVLSEFTRRKPDENVVHWLSEMDEEKLFISAITIGEIQRGIARMNESPRKTALLTWMNNGLVRRFEQRILSLDSATMFLWGTQTARMEQSGKPLGLMDSLIIATAMQNNLMIVTRNVSDFLPCGVQVINPWNS